MKKTLYTRLKKGVMVALAVGALASCNQDDFFLLPDRNGIDAAIWSTEGAINMHLNKTYELIMPKWPWQTVPSRFDIHLVSDENWFPSNGDHGARALGIAGTPLINHDVFYVGNRYTFNYLDNRYLDIARCNSAIKMIPEGSVPVETQRKFLGQYHVMRAMVYLELVKVYGGVPLVLEPQEPDNVMADGRASARRCFEQIVDDLNKGMEYLKDVAYEGNEWGRITYEAAAAYKAKALLYWASPQFNPLDDPKHPFDQSRWEEAMKANQEAYDICLAAGHSLVPNYADIFRTKGSANPEVIMSRAYSNTLPNRGNNIEQKTRPESEGGSPHNAYRATLKLLQAYPMKDGNVIGESEYTYDNVLFWKDRDPRFEATFAYNGSTWALSNKKDRRQWTYAGATNGGVLEGADWGVYCKRFTTPNLPSGNVEPQEGIGGSGMDWIEFRLAEVMLNLAECANEVNNMGLAKDMVRQIRQRAGIEVGNNDYGLGNVSSKEEMRELLLNERFIEFAFENKRNSDLRRTRNWSKLTGEWIETIRIEVKHDPNDPKAGDVKKAMIAELEKVVDEQTGLTFRETIDINNHDEYLEYFNPYSIVLQPNGFRPINIPEYHNFYTFHNDFIFRGQNIEPTIGWEGGTFDPLDD